MKLHLLLILNQLSILNMVRITSINFIKLVKKRLLISSCLLLMLFLSCDDAKAFNFEEINYLAKKCIRSRRINICKLALERVELYQEFAGLHSHYPCQTRLLGVQSDLIMVTLHASSKKSSAFKMLEAAKKACKKL